MIRTSIAAQSGVSIMLMPTFLGDVGGSWAGWRDIDVSELMPLVWHGAGDRKNAE